MIKYNGHKYYMKAKNKNTTVRWICVNNSFCSGALITDSSFYNVLYEKHHICMLENIK